MRRWTRGVLNMQQVLVVLSRDMLGALTMEIL